MQIAQLLQRHGKSSPVWVPGDGPALRQATAYGLDVSSYDSDTVFRKNRLRAIWSSWSFGRRLRRRGDGLVHVHSILHYGAMHFGLRWSGLRRLVHVHIEEHEECLRWALRRPPEVIVTCASFLVDYVRRCLPSDRQKTQRIVALPNAVDTDRFYPADRRESKAKVGAVTDRPLVLMLANLAPHKGQETVVRAVALLKNRGVEVACWLAGVEREPQGFTKRLEQLISDLGVRDRVRLLGYRNDAPELVRAADFLALPSTQEGLPLTIVEAQASQTAVLAAPTAGIPEVVQDGETGFLIAANDAPRYAAAIERLLAEPELYQRVVHHAFARTTREHSWTRYAARIEELYGEVLSDS